MPDLPRIHPTSRCWTSPRRGCWLLRYKSITSNAPLPPFQWFRYPGWHWMTLDATGCHWMPLNATGTKSKALYKFRECFCPRAYWRSVCPYNIFDLSISIKICHTLPSDPVLAELTKALLGIFVGQGDGRLAAAAAVVHKRRANVHHNSTCATSDVAERLPSIHKNSLCDIVTKLDAWILRSASWTLRFHRRVRPWKKSHTKAYTCIARSITSLRTARLTWSRKHEPWVKRSVFQTSHKFPKKCQQENPVSHQLEKASPTKVWVGNIRRCHGTTL